MNPSAVETATAAAPSTLRGEAALGRIILGLSIPMVVEQAMHNVFNFAELIWVGRLGAAATAAVGLAHVILIGVLGIAFGWGAAGAAAVARRIGSGDRPQASATATGVLLWGVLGATLLGLALTAAVGPILNLLGAPPPVVNAARPYLRIALAGVGLVSGANIATFALRAAGDATQAMTAFVAGTVATLLLQPVLIRGWGWSDAGLGMTGAALSLVAGRGLSLVLAVAMMARGRSALRLVRRGLAPAILRGPLMGMAAAGAWQAVLRNTAPFALYIVATPLGTVALAALNIVIKVLLIAQIIAQGLANAAATVVGQSLGSGRPERAAGGTRLAIAYAAGALGLVALALVVWPRLAVSPFTDDAGVVAAAAAGVRLVALAFPFVTIGVVLTGALNGAGDTASPALANLLTLGGIQIAVSVTLIRVLGWETGGLWAAMISAWIANGLLLTFLFRRGRWRRIVL